MLGKKEALEKINLYVLDMDGTVYLGENLIKGSDIFINKVRDQGKDLVFFTNNASRVPSFYQERLKRMGLEVEEKDIITSGDVTIEFLKTYYPEKRVYLNGTPLLENSFLESGILLVDEYPDVVVQSFDTTMHYDKMHKITNYIRDGVPFLATHCDINCPTEDGYMPDCGAMCALITSSTGVEPRYLGKPMKETLDMVLKITGHQVHDTAFVGDRIYTDVATGVNNGASGFLVMTGEADENTIRESDIEPTAVFESLFEISKYL